MNNGNRGTLTAHQRLAYLMALPGGGAALIMMIRHAGAAILRQWYFYPSAVLFTAMLLHFSGQLPGDGKLLWRAVQWWSGLWGCLFLSAFLIPPFSFWVLAPLMEGPIHSSGVNPLLAGFFHLVMWGCAKDVLEEKTKGS